ncbi:MAG TPA: long-chain fatty acid--CoA ligase [Acidimicrobiia bacterium]|jgi:long-chain acyl-CoA synthetase
MATVIELQQTGAAAETSHTIVDVFRRQVRDRASAPALRRNVDGRWETITWAEYGEIVGEITAGLVALGVEPGDRVGLLSQNRVEWVEADVGVIAAGAVTVPVYPTSAASQVAYVLSHSGARVAFVENDEQLGKIFEQRDALPALERVVVFGSDEIRLDDPFVMTLDELREIGGDLLQRDPRVVDDRAAGVRGEDLVTLVYTSGTTGPPKGAMLTHRNVTATIDSILQVISIGPDDRFLSYLPLSHIAERTTSHFGQIVSGGETWFARSIGTIAEDLPACRPTVFFAVPRVWEKFRDALLREIDHQHGPRRMLADWYLALGPGWVAEHQGGPLQSLPKKSTYLALDRVVGATIRRTVGLDAARILVSAAAPVHPDLLRWLHGIGLPVIEVYGQTEDCGPTTMNPPEAARIGTVGPPLPDVDVRLADDGEVLVKGPNVCAGYFNNPEGTAELIDADGWMHSGDVGRFDGAYLMITDRKKDLIITAHGKNIAPQEIETRLKYEPLISQAVVIGEGRPYLTALITLDPDETARWCGERGKPREPEALAWDAELRDEIEAAVDRTNAELSHVETIRKWRILPQDFTIAAGELTPTLKVRRAIVAEHYAGVIEEMYAEVAR